MMRSCAQCGVIQASMIWDPMSDEVQCFACSGLCVGLREPCGRPVGHHSPLPGNVTLCPTCYSTVVFSVVRVLTRGALEISYKLGTVPPTGERHSQIATVWALILLEQYKEAEHYAQVWKVPLVCKL